MRKEALYQQLAGVQTPAALPGVTAVADLQNQIETKDMRFPETGIRNEQEEAETERGLPDLTQKHAGRYERKALATIATTAAHRPGAARPNAAQPSKASSSGGRPPAPPQQ